MGNILNNNVLKFPGVHDIVFMLTVNTKQSELLKKQLMINRYVS